MLKLRMLNAIAPAYFYTATAVTFVLHFFLFLPTIFQTQNILLSPVMLLHISILLFFMLNALGNYSMTIQFPAESATENVIPVCSPDCPDRVDAHYLLNGRHFCKLCKKVILKRDHHCFFTGNCIGNRNMRYFIMFSIYTSCTCLYSLVLGVAYLTVEYAISFENPLTFLTLLPLSTGYFFLGKLFLIILQCGEVYSSPQALPAAFVILPLFSCRYHLRPSVLSGHHALHMVRYWFGERWFLLPTNLACGPWTNLVPATEGAASGESGNMAIQFEGCIWFPLGSGPLSTGTDCGDHSRKLA